MKKTDNKSVKLNNKSLILNCLKNGSFSRAEIAEKTGLSKAAVTLLVNEFISNNEITEQGIFPQGTVGRPKIALELVKNSHFAIGFSLHRKKLSATIVNLVGDPIKTVSADTKGYTSPAAAIDYLYESIFKTIREENLDETKILGIGVSSPGPLDYKDGIIFSPPNLNLFNNFNVKNYLKTKTNLPVFLDNNAVLLALREDNLRNKHYKNNLFLVSSEGIGSAVLINRKIFRGSSGHSGEIGHITVEPHGIPCPCGNKGCLERYISLAALKEKFNIENLDSALKDEKISENVTDYIVKYLSDALISAVNILDLDCIIIYGELNDKNSIIAGKLEAEINKRSIISNAHKISVLPSLQGDEGIELCAASAVINAYFEQRI